MRLVALVVLAGCSFTAAGPAETIAIVDDDFARGTITEGVVTPWGTLEPHAFSVGGLHAVAFDGNHVEADDTIDDVAGKAMRRLGAGYRQVPGDFGGAGRARGLGIPANAPYTVIYDGEILLQVGIQRLELAADDRAIVEVFGQTLTAATGGTPSISLDVRQEGWYPIRIAHGQQGGPARVVLTSVFGLTREVIGAGRLRARITEHTGLVAFAFDTEVLAVPRGETAVPNVDAVFDVFAPPFDIDMSFDHFSVRHAGQLRIDAAATYAFRAETNADDWYRLWIDGVLVASTWNGAEQPAGTIDLAAGWHDLVFDYADPFADARVRLLMNDAVIDPAQLRPAVARGLVAIDLVAATTFDIPDPGELMHPFDIAAPADAVIDSVDVGVGIRNHRLSDLSVELLDCMDARPLTLAVNDALLEHFFYFPDDARCAGTPVAASPPWQLRLVDGEAGNNGLLDPEIFTPVLVASYHGGERAPFAPSVVYISEPYETPGAFELLAARAIADAGGGFVELSVRTAPDAAALEAQPWTVVTEAGSLPPPSAFVQFQLVLGGDGWQYPAADRVELEYRAR